MIPLLILGTAIIGTCAGYLVLRRWTSKAEVYHFRCPGCDLKVRYGAGQEGQRIRCPRCLRSSTLNPYVQNVSPARSPYRFRYYRPQRR